MYRGEDLHLHTLEATPQTHLDCLEFNPRLNNERDWAQAFSRPARNSPAARRDTGPAISCAQHFDDNVIAASSLRRLEKPEIKFIAQGILEALQVFHEDGYVHTGVPYVKPDNNLVKYGGTYRFRQVELSDCGDACLVNPKDHLKLGKRGHQIGAHMFRSPEAMLNLRRSTPTDIWSFDTTPDPGDAGPDDGQYPNHVPVKQIAFSGLFPLSYFDILPEGDDRWDFIGDVTQYIINNQKWKPFAVAEDEELAKDDQTLSCKIMKLDTGDRPTANALLQDPWLTGV